MRILFRGIRILVADLCSDGDYYHPPMWMVRRWMESPQK